MAKKEVNPTTVKVEDKSEPAEAVSVASEIGSAIADAIRDTKEDKNIKITVDESVVPRFSLVKNKQGEVMIRENETGKLSSIQLKSIEEKEADIQSQEVEEV